MYAVYMAVDEETHVQIYKEIYYVLHEYAVIHCAAWGISSYGWRGEIGKDLHDYEYARMINGLEYV